MDVSGESEMQYLEPQDIKSPVKLPNFPTTRYNLTAFGWLEWPRQDVEDADIPPSGQAGSVRPEVGMSGLTGVCLA